MNLLLFGGGSSKCLMDIVGGVMCWGWSCFLFLGWFLILFCDGFGCCYLGIWNGGGGEQIIVS